MKQYIFFLRKRNETVYYHADALSLSLFRSLTSVTRQIIIYLAGKRKLVTKKRSDDHVVGAWTSMIGWWLVTKKRSDDHVAGAWTSMIGWWLVSA